MYATFNQDLSIPAQTSIFYPFEPPAQFLAEKISENQIRLSWQTQSVDEYKIYKKINSSEWLQLAVLNDDLSEYFDNDVSLLSNSYSYKISSVYHNIESDCSPVNIVSPEMILINAGDFFINDNFNVSLSSFLICPHEVTEAEWLQIWGSLPPNCSGGDKPVNNISWLQATAFCNKKSVLDGLTPCYSYGSAGSNPSEWGNDSDQITCDWSANGYRLPTECEWMYAANEAVFAINYVYSGSNDLNSVGWYYDNSNNTKHLIQTKNPNALYLYDMSGNVSEWCWDYYGNYPSGSFGNYHGPLTGTNRTHRGGNYSSGLTVCRTTNRGYNIGEGTYSVIGFRIVKNYTP